MKIVSLIPSGTEIVSALNAEELLVGRSHECDFPPSVKSLPVCTAANLDSSQNSLEIDRQVKALLNQALSIYRLEEETLKGLEPDVLVTQTQCDVCAVSLPTVEAALGDWMKPTPRLISLNAVNLEGVWQDIRNVAEALGKSGEGEKLLRIIQGRIDKVTSQAQSVSGKPKVACLEWFEPLMGAGNWVPELVELAGGTSVTGKPGEHSPWLEWETLLQMDPDLILLMPCGFDLLRVREEMAVLWHHPDWENLRAVKTGNVFLLDGNQYFNRPGPRLVDSLEILAEIFHPALFPPVYQGKGWIKLSPEAY